MLSISQTLAGKALQADDKNLKGLLAYQAYIFNKDYNGQPDHPDVYKALYSAMGGFNGQFYNGYKGHEGSVRSIAFIPRTNLFYTSGHDGKILRWELNGNSKSYRVLISNNFINRSLAISADGRWLANGTTTTGIQLFDLSSGGNLPEILEGQKGWIVALTFTSDSKGLFSASSDKTILYYDIATKTSSKFATINSDVRCLTVSPSGKYLFGGTDDGKLIRWDMDTKEETVIFSSNNNTIFAISINSTGSKLAFVDKNGTLRVADARTNRILNVVSAHSVRILDVKFSPDDRQIATSSMDKTVKIWDANNLNNLPITITGHNAFVMAVAFSSDGTYLVSSGDMASDSSIPNVFSWPTHASNMADQMCGRLNRNLSQREWETYIGYDIQYQKTCSNIP